MGEPGHRSPPRYGPSATATLAKGGCTSSYVYVPLSSHSIPAAIWKGSSYVWLKVAYVGNNRATATKVKSNRMATLEREMRRPAEESSADGGTCFKGTF